MHMTEKKGSLSFSFRLNFSVLINFSLDGYCIVLMQGSDLAHCLADLSQTEKFSVMKLPLIT